MSKDLTAFIISFILLFVSVIPEPLLGVNFSIKLSIFFLSTQYIFKPVVNSSALFINYLAPSLALMYGISTNTSARDPPNCASLDNWAFKNFILADEPFGKSSPIFETLCIC